MVAKNSGSKRPQTPESLLSCDPSRHLQECSGAWAGKCPTECFLSVFGRLARSAPKSAFWVLFGVFLPQKRQKALKKHSQGHSEPGAQKHSKRTPWGTFQPRPLSTPVNVTRSRPQSEFQVINLFLCREECGEVFGSFRVWQILSHISWGKYERKFATKNPPGFSRERGGCKNPKFHHLDLLGPPSLNKWRLGSQLLSHFSYFGFSGPLGPGGHPRHTFRTDSDLKSTFQASCSSSGKSCWTSILKTFSAP